MWNWSGLAMPILVSAALKSTIVLGAAWLVTLGLRRRSAAGRHLVWTAAAAALLALPLLSVSLPSLRVGPNGGLLPADLGLVFQATGTAANSGPTATVPPVAGKSWLGAPSPARRTDWKTWLILLWATGIAISFARILIACGAMWRVRQNARPSPDSGCARALAEALGIHQEVEVLETRRGGMPMTFGLLRPAIFMPADADSWTEDRRRMVLLHELAHVRRGDVATHLMARIALSLYWWNPLAWTAWREFLKERERAADDLVLNSGARAAEYAGHLLDVARTMQAAPATAWAAIAMARPSQLEGRLVAILDPGRKRWQPGRAAAVVGALLAIAVVAPVAAVQSQEEPAAPRATFRAGLAPAAPQSAEEQAAAAEVDATIRTANNQKNHEMVEQAAAAFENVRKYGEAQKLREAALNIREQVSGPQSLDYAIGLVNLGDLLRKRGKITDAESAYAKAVAAMGDRAETASALLFLSMGAYRNHDFDKAMEYAQRARNVSSGGPKAGKAMTWMAQIREKQVGGGGEAEALYTGALTLEEPKSADAALTMELYANFLRSQDRPSEAEVMESRAAGTRKALVAEISTKRAAAGMIATNASQAGRVGNGITAPKLLSKVEPEYSDEARAGKIAGTVLLTIVVEPNGQASNFQLLKGMGYGLDEKAVEAITRWRFQPATRDGAPVPVLANIEVNFRLM